MTLLEEAIQKRVDELKEECEKVTASVLISTDDLEYQDFVNSWLFRK